MPSEREIPARLAAHFQEYDVSQLDLERDCVLVMQRVLEYGNWDEIRWLLAVYGSDRLRGFLSRYGERQLGRRAFNYWRKLFEVRSWRETPFPTPKGELWDR